MQPPVAKYRYDVDCLVDHSARLLKSERMYMETIQ